MRRLLASVPVAVAGTLAGVLVIFLMLETLVLSRWGADAEPAREKTPAEVRQELEQTDREKLGTYGWVDRKTGRVRIPIESAMEKLLAEEEGR
jgi:hypothetical protein